VLELFERYRNVTALIAAVGLQLILLGYQVRRDDDMTMLRSWTVGAVLPLERGLHLSFDSVSSVWRNYVWLVGAREENAGMRRELDVLRLQNQELRREMERSSRREQLVGYQSEIESETVIAEVISVGASRDSREVFVDRGQRDRVRPGMAVLTPEGIVGKVQASYPRAALVLLINDADAAVGVVLGGSRVRGVMKGRGGVECFVDYVSREVEVEVGERIYTSGDDRIFPKGLPVGEVVRLAEGGAFQSIWVRPYARLDRLDDVLIVSSGVHQQLPASPLPQTPGALMPLPPPDAEAFISSGPAFPGLPAESQLNEANKLKRRYRAVAEAQGMRIGVAELGDPAPDFNSSPTPALEPLPVDEAATPAPAQ